MRICLIGKFPPIQGGVSGTTYWLARRLAQAGNEVHVVTNAAEVEQEYRVQLSSTDADWLASGPLGQGSLQVHFTIAQLPTHIPQSNPYVTKLAGLAVEVVRRYRCDIIYSHYFEPYGIAGMLASTWTGVPHVIRHAGSDRYRLMDHVHLGTSYRELMRAADGIVSPGGSFEGLGIREAQALGTTKTYVPRDVFHQSAAPMGFAALDASACWVPPGVGAFDEGRATIGIYGKVGRVKGSYELVDALSDLVAGGLRFNFVPIVCGADVERYLDYLACSPLGAFATVLRPVPPWRIAGYLRACDVVAYLERDFPIAGHAPVIPVELFATGTCAVLSNEVAAKQATYSDMASGENCVLIPDPKDVSSLRDSVRPLLEEPSRARQIGRAGVALAGPDEGETWVEFFEGAFERALCSSADASGPPVTSSNVGDRFRTVLGEDKYEECSRTFLPGVACQHPLVERLAMADWLAKADPDRIELLEAIAHLEWLETDVESIVGTGQFPDDLLPTPLTAEEIWRARPILSNWSRIITLSVETRVELGALGVDHFLAGTGTQCYLLHKRGSLTYRIYRLGSETARLLRCCNGVSTVEDLAGPASEPFDVCRAFHAWAQRGVVGFIGALAFSAHEVGSE